MWSARVGACNVSGGSARTRRARRVLESDSYCSKAIRIARKRFALLESSAGGPEGGLRCSKALRGCVARKLSGGARKRFALLESSAGVPEGDLRWARGPQKNGAGRNRAKEPGLHIEPGCRATRATCHQAWCQLEPWACRRAQCSSPRSLLSNADKKLMPEVCLCPAAAAVCRPMGTCFVCLPVRHEAYSMNNTFLCKLDN